jgi:hypothetical protein
MKKLILGALLAAASSVGCSSSSDSVVDVSWTFTHLADNSERSCPSGFDTASIISQTIDPVSHHLTGLQVVDKFDCAAGHGSITLPDDTFLIWVEITNTSGSQTYAQSASSFVDTSFGDATFDTEILDDGGYFFFTWDLTDPNGALLSCANAGITSSGSVDIISSSVASSSYVKEDKFTCADHYGTTEGLLAGEYDITIQAENGGIRGVADPITDTIDPQNGLTDLGNVLIPITQ